MTPFDLERWLSEKTARARAIHCPECGSLDPLPLVLGMPGAELAEASERGEVALGGCVVPPGPRPVWRCRSCLLEFPDPVDASSRACSDADMEAALLALDVAPSIIPASEWPGTIEGLDESGLYSWWVDLAGAVALTDGLGETVEPRRIYAGQAGATAWPSGTPSNATLASRISSQHLSGNIYGSTFRLTVASCLASALGLTPIGPKRLAPGDEAHLSAWILDHLSLAVHPYPDRDALEELELRVLTRLDPPLNLRGMATSEARIALRAARKRLSSRHPARWDGSPPDWAV